MDADAGRIGARLCLRGQSQQRGQTTGAWERIQRDLTVQRAAADAAHTAALRLLSVPELLAGETPALLSPFRAPLGHPLREEVHTRWTGWPTPVAHLARKSENLTAD